MRLPSHRSTVDVLAQLEYHIYDTYWQRQVMVALFADLEGAFDTAPHQGILYKLVNMGITGSTLVWIKHFLTSRSYRVTVGGSTSPPHPIRRGVPQGSILSPLLFKIPHLLVYADDITIITRATILAQAQNNLQAATTSLQIWISTWVLSINAFKGTIMCFTRKRLPSPPTITLSGLTIPYSTTHTFLGLRQDGPRLS